MDNLIRSTDQDRSVDWVDEMGMLFGRWATNNTTPYLMSNSLENLTVTKLKERCRAKGLPVSGVKSALIARLRALENQKAPTFAIAETIWVDLPDDLMQNEVLIYLPMEDVIAFDDTCRRYRAMVRDISFLRRYRSMNLRTMRDNDQILDFVARIGLRDLFLEFLNIGNYNRYVLQQTTMYFVEQGERWNGDIIKAIQTKIHPDYKGNYDDSDYESESSEESDGTKDDNNGGPTVETNNDGAPTVETNNDGVPTVETNNDGAPTVETNDDAVPTVQAANDVVSINGANSIINTLDAPSNLPRLTSTDIYMRSKIIGIREFALSIKDRRWIIVRASTYDIIKRSLDSDLYMSRLLCRILSVDDLLLMINTKPIHGDTIFSIACIMVIAMIEQERYRDIEQMLRASKENRSHLYKNLCNAIYEYISPYGIKQLGSVLKRPKEIKKVNNRALFFELAASKERFDLRYYHLTLNPAEAYQMLQTMSKIKGQANVRHYASRDWKYKADNDNYTLWVDTVKDLINPKKPSENSYDSDDSV